MRMEERKTKTVKSFPYFLIHDLLHNAAFFVLKYFTIGLNDRNTAEIHLEIKNLRNSRSQ